MKTRNDHKFDSSMMNKRATLLYFSKNSQGKASKTTLGFFPLQGHPPSPRPPLTDKNRQTVFERFPKVVFDSNTTLRPNTSDFESILKFVSTYLSWRVMFFMKATCTHPTVQFGLEQKDHWSDTVPE